MHAAAAAAGGGGGGAPAPRADPAWGALAAALRRVLAAGTEGTLDRAIVAEALSLPSPSELLTQCEGPTDPLALYRAREATVQARRPTNPGGPAS